MSSTVLLALAAGVCIAAAAGLRAFLPLLALGLAARFHLLGLHPGMEWLATDAALWAFGTAAVLEIAADKIPVVDHALDAIGTAVRPAAAVVGAYAALDGWGTPWAQLAALALGVGALGVHVAKAKTRLGSTAMTLGHANPLLSIGEDLASAGLLALAILVPIVALLGLVALLALWRWSAGRARGGAPRGTPISSRP